MQDHLHNGIVFRFPVAPCRLIRGSQEKIDKIGRLHAMLHEGSDRFHDASLPIVQEHSLGRKTLDWSKTAFNR